MGLVTIPVHNESAILCTIIIFGNAQYVVVGFAGPRQREGLVNAFVCRYRVMSFLSLILLARLRHLVVVTNVVVVVGVVVRSLRLSALVM